MVALLGATFHVVAAARVQLRSENLWCARPERQLDPPSEFRRRARTTAAGSPPSVVDLGVVLSGVEQRRLLSFPLVDDHLPLKSEMDLIRISRWPLRWLASEGRGAWREPAEERAREVTPRNPK